MRNDLHAESKFKRQERAEGRVPTVGSHTEKDEIKSRWTWNETCEAQPTDDQLHHDYFERQSKCTWSIDVRERCEELGFVVGRNLLRRSEGNRVD